MFSKHDGQAALMATVSVFDGIHYRLLTAIRYIC
jgi:hypothetical protein